MSASQTRRDSSGIAVCPQVGVGGGVSGKGLFGGCGERGCACSECACGDCRRNGGGVGVGAHRLPQDRHGRVRCTGFEYNSHVGLPSLGGLKYLFVIKKLVLEMRKLIIVWRKLRLKLKILVLILKKLTVVLKKLILVWIKLR